MGYDLYDFTESLSVAGVPEQRIEACTFAFGDSPEGFGSWEGGFVCHTKSGAPWIFVFGWCDTTGWGCQDGAWVVEFDHEPTRDEVIAAWTAEMPHYEPPLDGADEMPADLNRYIHGEIDRWGKPPKEGER